VRTTLTIEDDLMRDLRDVAHREGLPFKQLVNRLLRLGLQRMQEPRRRRRYRLPTFSMGAPVGGAAALDKALAIATALEDEEIARKLDLRK
jgi:hypothetical protein